MENLTILITSCGAYSDMWSNVLSLFRKNWEDDTEIILTSDSEGKYDIKHPNELKIYKGEMSERIISALKDIHTKYVLITFDDYYLDKKADINILKETITYMDKEGISYCGTAFNVKKGKKFKAGNLKLLQFDLKETYEINFYPSIWNREDLISCLKADEDIWTSEAMLTKRLRKNNKAAIMLLNKNAMSFLDVCRKGKYLRNAYPYLKKHNLFISDRKIRTRRETLSLKIRLFVSLHAPKFIKKRAQAIYRKKGNVIYSDISNTEE